MNDVLISYDEDNCYDCAVHNIFSITDQAFDMTLSAIIYYFKWEKEMNFYIRNVFGAPKGSYSGTMIHNFKRICRVNGRAPPGWFLTICILIIYFTDKGEGFEIKTGMTADDFELENMVFFDDRFFQI